MLRKTLSFSSSAAVILYAHFVGDWQAVVIMFYCYVAGAWGE